MGFWQQQPLSCERADIQPILSRDALLEQVESQRKQSKYTLTYEVLTDITVEQRTHILDFINTYYLITEKGSVIYSHELLQYFLQDSIIIRFFKKPADTLGIIVGKKKRLQIYATPIETIEVNFLSLHPKLRSLHLAPYMIQTLTRETILRLSIHTAFYTVGTRIQSPMFGTKVFYHRPICIETLAAAGFFSKDISRFKKQFNTFSATIEPRYIHGSDPEYAGQLAEGLKRYSEKTYSIFNIYTREEINAMFSCPVFHTFVFEDDCVILYCIQNKSVNGYAYTNAVIYVSMIDTTRTKRILDSIAQYCLRHHIADIITFSDIFAQKHALNCVEGTGVLHYYAFNMNMHPIENSRNALVTL
ncbi:hypothetical protein EBR66_05900 [bacterium]|nr:hypothetical protein [bacterium]